MKKTIKLRIIWIAVAVSAFLSSYTWACFVAGNCICATSGSCYGKVVLPDCQIPSCILADASATAWNVCSGNGPYQGRQQAPDPVQCCPSACRVYDICTQQYMSFDGASCCFPVQRYQGTGSNCL